MVSSQGQVKLRKGFIGQQRNVQKKVKSSDDPGGQKSIGRQIGKGLHIGMLNLGWVCGGWGGVENDRIEDKEKGL